MSTSSLRAFASVPDRYAHLSKGVERFDDGRVCVLQGTDVGIGLRDPRRSGRGSRPRRAGARSSSRPTSSRRGGSMRMPSLPISTAASWPRACRSRPTGSLIWSRSPASRTAGGRPGRCRGARRRDLRRVPRRDRGDVACVRHPGAPTRAAASRTLRTEFDDAVRERQPGDLRRLPRRTCRGASPARSTRTAASSSSPARSMSGREAEASTAHSCARAGTTQSHAVPLRS